MKFSKKGATKMMNHKMIGMLVLVCLASCSDEYVTIVAAENSGGDESVGGSEDSSGGATGVAGDESVGGMNTDSGVGGEGQGGTVMGDDGGVGGNLMGGMGGDTVGGMGGDAVGGNGSEEPCVAGTRKCDGLTALLCDYKAEWQVRKECPFVCGDGNCSGECVPGTETCESQEVKFCNAQGNWEVTDTCPEACFENQCLSTFCCVEDSYNGDNYCKCTIETSCNIQTGTLTGCQNDIQYNCCYDAYDDTHSESKVCFCNNVNSCEQYVIDMAEFGSILTIVETCGN
jgi:hypothetical protein